MRSEQQNQRRSAKGVCGGRVSGRLLWAACLVGAFGGGGGNLLEGEGSFFGGTGTPFSQQSFLGADDVFNMHFFVHFWVNTRVPSQYVLVRF